MKDQKIIYSAIKLDAMGKKAIQQRFRTDQFNVFGDHMTIQFRPTDTMHLDFMEDNLGKKVHAVAYGRIKTKVVDILLVTPDRFIVGMKPFGHITLGTAEDVPPVVSNTVIQTMAELKTGVEIFSFPYFLSGHFHLEYSA